jgi:hypothetical protein
MLLHALVQVTLDPAPLGIGSQDEPLPGCAKLRDLVAQPIDGFAQRLDVPSLQRGSTSWSRAPRSCASSHRRRQGDQHPGEEMGSLSPHSPAATVGAAAPPS